MRNRRAIRESAIFAANVALLVGALACGSSSSTVTSPSTLSKCAVTVAVPGSTVPASGGAGTITVQTERECQWTAQPEVSWLSITAGSSGQGTGTVQFAASANADPAVRTGGVMVNGQRAQVGQAAGECKFELSSSAVSVPQTGGTGSVDVRASSGLCTWTAASDVDWISVTSNANGKGSAPVGFNVSSTTGPPRTGTLTIAGIHFSITQSEGCSYTVTPSALAMGAAGGSQALTITAGAGCPWTASSNQPWITITSGASGNGAGSVMVSIAAANGPSRSGTLAVAGQTITVTQGDGCAFAISPDAQSVAPSGGTGNVSVTAPAGCAWSAASNQPWISITAGASGSGNGTVTFTAASTTGPGRSGTLTIAGRTFTVNQGQGCTFSLSAVAGSAAAAGVTGTFDVRTADGCAWSAGSNVAWLTVTGGASGTGNGTVRYAVAANTGPQRTGTMVAGGQIFTVTQAEGCSYAISPSSQNIGTSGGSASVAVTAPAGCSWNASSNAGWIGLTSGSSGSGNGTVQLTVAANADAERRGTVTIAGQTFTVIQSSGCTFSLAPTGQTMPASGGPGSFTVNANPSCAWTAAPNAPWITITSGTSGNGQGAVQFVADANTAAARSGTITAGGQTFTIAQETGCVVSLNPTSQLGAVGAGSGSVAVATDASCTWTAVSNAAWIAVTSGATGAGNGTVQFTFEANVTGMPRSGTITIGGQPFTINQAGS